MLIPLSDLQNSENTCFMYLGWGNLCRQQTWVSVDPQLSFVTGYSHPQVQGVCIHGLDQLEIENIFICVSAEPFLSFFSK